jgi:tetratricopeptide (TPR) repeat protein
MVAVIDSSEKESKEQSNLLEEGKELEEKGKYVQAIEIYKKLYDLDPNDPVPRKRIEVIELIRKGINWRQKGYVKEAGDAFSQAIELDPDNVAAISLRALNYIGINPEFTELAKKDISLAESKNPNDPWYLISAADFEAYSGNNSMASTLINLACDKAEDYHPIVQALIIREMGYIDYNMGLLELSISQFKKSYNLNPDDTWTIMWMADAKFGMDDYKGAISCYKEAIKKKCVFNYIFFSLGLAYFSDGAYKEAVEAFNEGLKLDPENPNILCGKAFALSNVGKGYNDSLRLFEYVLKKDRYNVAARFGKVWVGKLAQKEYQIQEKIKEVHTRLLESSDSVITSTSRYLEYLLEDFKKGLNLVKNMFFVQFILGVSLLVGAVIAAVYNNAMATAILGVTGGASILITFIRESPLQIQKNRVDFSQWMMGYFNWYNAFLETNMVLGQKASSNEKIEMEDIREIEDYLYNYTQNTIKLIEECCEFKEPRGKESSGGKDNMKDQGQSPEIVKEKVQQSTGQVQNQDTPPPGQK